MKKQNLLFFCNDLELVKNRINSLKAQYQIYCVSHNTDIYIDDELKGFDDVVTLPYDLNCAPFFEDARHVIEAVNTSFKDVKTEKSFYLYELNCLCEGGMGQRYADYLYAIAFFKKVIQEYKINIIYSEKLSDSKEIDALKNVAQNEKIKIHFVNRKTFSLCEIKKRIYFSLIKVPGISLLISLETQLQYIFRIKKSAKKYKIDSDVEQYDIAYIMTFNTNKHINWLLEELEEIEKQFRYCIFCYQAGNAEEKLVNLGKHAKSVEGYFDFKMALKDWRDYLKDSLAISRQVKKMSTIYFQKIDITKTVRKFYTMYYLYREKVNDIVYERIVYEFLKKNQTKMMTGGSTNYISTKMFYFNTQKLNRKVTYYQNNAKNYLYDYMKMPMEESEPYSYIMNLRFAVYGSERIEILKQNGWQGEVYYLPDSRKKLYYKDNALQNKLVWKASITKILWAPSYPFAGLYSIYDFIMDNEVVLQSMDKYNCETIVKYHPGQQEGLSNYVSTQYKKSEKIEFVSQYDGIEQYLDQAEIVFTKVSTVLIDAALKGKLVICLAEDLDMKMLRDDIKESFYLVKRDDIDFEKVLFDLNFRNIQISKQNILLEKWFYNPDNRKTVDILDKYILEADFNNGG